MPRRQILRAAPETILHLGKLDGIRTVGQPIPQDARVVHRMIDQRGDLLLLVESESFADVPDGEFYSECLSIGFRNPAS
jgi:hypothetical protein